MPDPDLVLYHFPGACSRVSICALEMAGLPYRVELVNLAAGAQSEPEYMAISPLGKVPLLLVDGRPLAENAAILTFLAALRLDAGILPADPTPFERAEMVGGMSFCGGTLHPQIRGLANPSRMTVGDGEPVREKSRSLASKSFGFAERRLAERGWWLGERSIIDVYIDWAFFVARNAGFDASPYPSLNGLEDRLGALPAYRAMQQDDIRSRAALGL
jgi:glutathione S-transferase